MQGDRKLLSRNEFLELSYQVPAVFVRLALVDDHAERVHRVAVDQDFELGERVGTILHELVVERSVPARAALQSIVEVEDDLGARELEVELDPLRIEVVHPAERAAPLVAELLHVPDVLGWADDPCLDDRLGDVDDRPGIG